MRTFGNRMSSFLWNLSADAVPNGENSTRFAYAKGNEVGGIGNEDLCPFFVWNFWKNGISVEEVFHFRIGRLISVKIRKERVRVNMVGNFKRFRVLRGRYRKSSDFRSTQFGHYSEEPETFPQVARK